MKASFIALGVTKASFIACATVIDFAGALSVTRRAASGGRRSCTNRQLMVWNQHFTCPYPQLAEERT